MRTPAETLKRLAEVAPEEWGAHVLDGRFFASAIGGITVGNRDGCDVVNGRFLAWCKRQLREMGYWIHSEVWDDSYASAFVGTSKDGEHDIECRGYPTEWQAVAECVIVALESNDADM